MTAYFSPIENHALLWERIDSAIDNQRMPQASILIGPRHVGVHTFAHRLAALLLCKSINKPCGNCDSCHLLGVETHPDFKLITPETDGGIIKIDQVRALQDDVYHTPTCSFCRVFLIDKADRMNTASANALLKILEEPPPDVYFILVAEQTGTVPATIMSRCQRFVFPDQTFDSFNYFALGSQYAVESARGKLFTKRDEIITAICEVIEGNSSPCTVAAQWAEFDLSDIIWLLYVIIAQALQMKYVATPAKSSQGELTRLLRLTKPNDLLCFFDKINTISRKMIHNVSMNTTLALEDLLMDLARIENYVR